MPYAEVGSTKYKNITILYRGTFLVPILVPTVFFQKWYQTTGTAVVFLKKYSVFSVFFIVTYRLKIKLSLSL